MLVDFLLMFSMFVESTGGFVINFRATLFGIVVGIGAATLIFYNKR